MPAQDSRSTEWDQESFENSDRRRSRKKLSAGSIKQHDILHLDFDSATKHHVHAILDGHTRHTDSVHTHGDSVFVNSPPGDAAGLRAKLEPHFKANNLAVKMTHGTFAADTDLKNNLSSLKGS
jgi:hypothetical protein